MLPGFYFPFVINLHLELGLHAALKLGLFPGQLLWASAVLKNLQPPLFLRPWPTSAQSL